MKTVFNILVILVVAVLIGGLFYGVVTASSSGTNQTLFQDNPSNFVPDRERPSEGGQLPVDSIKNLVIISLVATGYLNVTKYLARRKAVVRAST